MTELMNLTGDERSDLAAAEVVIQGGLSHFIQVGLALTEIRERRLYREHHRSFADYLEQRWPSIGRRYADRLITAAEIHTEVQSDGLAITSERQARELAKVPPGQRAAVLKQAAAIANTPTPSGVAIKAVIAPPLPPPPAPAVTLFDAGRMEAILAERDARDAAQAWRVAAIARRGWTIADRKPDQQMLSVARWDLNGGKPQEYTIAEIDRLFDDACPWFPAAQACALEERGYRFVRDDLQGTWDARKRQWYWHVQVDGATIRLVLPDRADSSDAPTEGILSSLPALPLFPPWGQHDEEARQKAAEYGVPFLRSTVGYLVGGYRGQASDAFWYVEFLMRYRPAQTNAPQAPAEIPAWMHAAAHRRAAVLSSRTVGRWAILPITGGGIEIAPSEFPRWLADNQPYIPGWLAYAIEANAEASLDRFAADWNGDEWTWRLLLPNGATDTLVIPDADAPIQPDWIAALQPIEPEKMQYGEVVRLAETQGCKVSVVCAGVFSLRNREQLLYMGSFESVIWITKLMQLRTQRKLVTVLAAAQAAPTSAAASASASTSGLVDEAELSEQREKYACEEVAGVVEEMSEAAARLALIGIAESVATYGQHAGVNWCDQPTNRSARLVTAIASGKLSRRAVWDVLSLYYTWLMEEGTETERSAIAKVVGLDSES